MARGIRLESTSTTREVREMALEVSAAFILTGSQISPDDITDLIGVQPSQTWLTGDSIQRTALKRKHDGWSLATDPANELDLAKPVQALLDVLEPHREGILEAKRKYDLNAEFSIGAYVEEDIPIVHFEESLVARIALLEAAIDVDIILVGED